MATYSFTGSPTLPIATFSGEIADYAPFTFEGDMSLPVFGISGYENLGNIFEGALTLPSINNSEPLVSDPSSDDLVSYPSGDPLYNTRFLEGSEILIVKANIGNLQLPMPTISGSFDLVRYIFQGILRLPSIVSISSTTLINRRFTFTGALTLPHPHHTNGSYGHPSPHNFTGNIILPTIVVRGRKIRPNGPIIIGNEGPMGPAVDGASYDPDNQITGDPSDYSITLRKPELGNRETPALDPKIQIAINGKARTYVERPVKLNLSMTWKLLNCNDEILSSLLGVLAFQQMRIVIDNETYIAVMLDDEYKIIYEARSSNRVTLNFEGRKLASV